MFPFPGRYTTPAKYKLEVNRGMPFFYSCPGCGRDKTFQRYVYIETGVQVANDVGRCKAKGCGYCYPPFSYFKDNNIQPTPNVAPSFISNEIFIKSLKRYQDNNLFLYLKKQFGEDQAHKSVEIYSIGTSKVYPGASVLWRIDREDKKREGRIALFDAETGKEDGGRWQSKGWVSRSIPTERFNVVDCLFGENLLKKELGKPVVIVEDERSALLGSCLYPDYLWLAMCNGAKAPNRDMCTSLSSRTVTWFPLTGFDKLKNFAGL